MEIRSRNDLNGVSDKEVKKLADGGNYIAIFEYGMRLYCKNRYKQAFKYLYTLIDRDNYYIWQRIYDISCHLKNALTDKQKFELLCRIHSKDSGMYSYYLASYYEKGKGCRKSLKKYNELLAICAHDGSRYATIELAENYEKGYGVRKSLKKAFELYDHYLDEHCKRDWWCAYKAAYYRYHELGGAKKEMGLIEYDLRFAAQMYDEAKKLYIEIFGKEPDLNKKHY